MSEVLHHNWSVMACGPNWTIKMITHLFISYRCCAHCNSRIWQIVLMLNFTVNMQLVTSQKCRCLWKHLNSLISFYCLPLSWNFAVTHTVCPTKVYTVIFTVVTSASCVTVKKINFWYETAVIGTRLSAISIFFHRVNKLSILHWTKMVNSVVC